MDNESTETVHANRKTQKKKADEDENYCTTAPSAEHARANADDEPCDDNRG